MIRYEEMQIRKAELAAEAKEIRQRLLFLPEGQLECRKNRRGFQWYHNIDNRSIYLPKSEKTLAQQLAERTYLNRRLKEVRAEIGAIDAYGKAYEKRPKKTALQYLQKKEYEELLSPVLTAQQKSFLKWQNEEYPRNPSHPEHLTVETYWGEMVRSKSERDIFTLLRDRGIPCCYERQIVIDGIEVYPDFTILHPKTGKKYLWEHFGRMDDPEYRRKALRKLQLYIENGWIPGVNLIITMETQEQPLNRKQVLHQIEFFFSAEDQ